MTNDTDGTDATDTTNETDHTDTTNDTDHTGTTSDTDHTDTNDTVATPVGDAESAAGVDATYDYDPSIRTYPVPERGTIEIRGCPEDIDQRMERASFTVERQGLYRKSQRAIEPVEDGREYDVLTVRTLDGGARLRIDATDLVGTVGLTPSAAVRIDPKVDWSCIFEMLLAVYERRRSTDYRGVPTDRLLDEEADLDGILVALAINLLDGLTTIHRRGLLRELHVRRVDGVDGRGRIDLERTLSNHARGAPEPHWVQNEVEYDNAANSLLHYAGTTLLQLFRERARDGLSQQHQRIYSELHREMRRLEAMGITSDSRDVGAYRDLSLRDLPRQRHYYDDALYVAKAILSSSLGHQHSDGRYDLVVDYVMNMETLFEEYSQAVLEAQLDEIRAYDHVDSTASVAMRDSPTVTPFEDEGDVFHQPDHELFEGEESLAVLDSKYYAEGKDPVKRSPSRSRLFSYAYLLETDELGFLCPLSEPKERRVTQTDARLRVVGPDADEEFSPRSYEAAVHDYLFDVLVEREPALEILRAVEGPVASGVETAVCLEGVDADALAAVKSMSGPFTYRNRRQFSWRVLQMAGRLSWRAGNVTEFEDEGEWARDRIELALDERSPLAHTCVPVFCSDRSAGKEWLDCYFLNAGGDGSVESVEIELRTDPAKRNGGR
ncbi:McrC family protein [Halorussus salinus]|uniref:McrC family protein n=1 Tax=Halorussus salinus TaxID=1364935 RepID=UPI001EE494DE|nr:McrC family protein [Halorussus salinus]